MKNLICFASITVTALIMLGLNIPPTKSQENECIYYHSSDTGFMVADIDGQNPASFLPEGTAAVYWSTAQPFVYNFFEGLTTSLYLAKYPGSEPTSAGEFDPIFTAEWSSDNEWFAFTTYDGMEAQVWLLNVETQQVELVYETDTLVTGLSWSPDNMHISIVSSVRVTLVNTYGDIELQATFDEAEFLLTTSYWTRTGDSLLIEPGTGLIVLDLETQEYQHLLQFSSLKVADWLSDTELFVHVFDTPSGNWKMVVLNINTGETREPLPEYMTSAGPVYDTVMSHDRAQVALITGLFSVDGLLNYNIVVLDVDSGEVSQLTSFDDELLAYYDQFQFLELGVSWSLDDTKLAFSSWDGFDNEIYQLDVESGELFRITDDDISWNNPVIRPCPQTE